MEKIIVVRISGLFNFTSLKNKDSLNFHPDKVVQEVTDYLEYKKYLE